MKKQIPIFTFLLFFAFTTSCDSSEPRPADESPFGVFPLNDVSWGHERGLQFLEPDTEFIYNTETGELITIITYLTGRDIITYSVRQVGENRAELYCSKVTTWERLIFDNIAKVNSYDDTSWVTAPELYGRIYLEDKKVYFRDLGHNGEQRQLLYDFNLNVGDEFIVGGYYKFSVVSIDRILVGNEYRKRYNFDFKREDYPGYPGHSFSVVEGIGCTESFFHTINDPFMAVDPLPPSLKEVYYKNKIVWRG